MQFGFPDWCRWEQHGCWEFWLLRGHGRNIEQKRPKLLPRRQHSNEGEFWSDGVLGVGRFPKRVVPSHKDNEGSHNQGLAANLVCVKNEGGCPEAYPFGPCSGGAL